MITAEQAIARSTRIGSSDAAAIMGLDPFKSASDVYLEKIGAVESFAGNDATDRGNWLEPALIAFAEHKLGKRFIPNKLFIHESGLLCANLDAITPSMEEAIEAKSTVMGEEWGEAGTDEVPDRVQVQVHHQFANVTSLRVIWVPVVLPGYRTFDWRMYRCERNDELVHMVESSALKFMYEHVKPQTPPSDFKPSLEVLKRVKREPASSIDISPELVDAWIVANAAKKKAEDDVKEAQCAMIAALSHTEAGILPDGRRVTYFETTRKGYTVEETTFRQLRLVKAAKGK